MKHYLPQTIITKKRDNIPLSQDEINWFIEGITNNTITDAQISAFAMAVIFNKFTPEELVNFTVAMKNSGETLKWNVNGPLVDKHSTGGVGDVASLMLAPMVAACGVYVPMIAGRGLGHTGGTLDKLESIPGYNTFVTTEKFQEIVSKIGCAIIGQTAKLAPADKRIYAVRDTTGTTESLELITSSILSKKLAEGLNSLVMDVKAGNGAFLTKFEEAVALAESISSIGTKAGCKTIAILTDMNQPLSTSGGNALEVVEVLKYLKGDFSNSRLHEVVLTLASYMLMASGVCNSEQAATTKLLDTISSGKALELFAKMVVELGGPADFIEKSDSYLVKANLIKPVYAKTSGYVSNIDTKKLGYMVVGLGGGRLKVEDKVDFSVGFSDITTLGSKVDSSTPLAVIHAKDENSFQIAANTLLQSITIVEDKNQVKVPPTIHKYIGRDFK